MRIESKVSITNTLQLPCTAHQRYVVESIEDFPTLMRALNGKPFRVMGGGSNVLCASHTMDIVVQVAIPGIQLLRSDSDAFIVHVAAGEGWHDMVMHTLAQGWAGLENLAFIPGWVGAAPVQNIGAYGVELCDRLHSVQAWDTQAGGPDGLGAMVDFAAADCGFAYRDSVFKQQAGRYLIAGVTLKLPRPWLAVLHYGELAQLFLGKTESSTTKSTEPSPQAIADAVIAIRQRKLPDPKDIANAGSFFKNPLVSNAQASALKLLHPTLPCYAQTDGAHTKLAAGWLIERSGWKGYTRTNPDSGGTVGVHAAQALVLVHLGGAQGADLLQLSQDIQASVLGQFGVVLEREVNVWSGSV